MYWHEKKQFFHSLCNFFFLFVEKKAIVKNTIGCQWHGHGTEIKGIDTVYLEPVPWLLKGSEDYCFKK